jgi:hypothetical protein
MLRHRALMQCARIAFGFAISDPEDVPAHIAEKDMGKAQAVATQQLPAYQAEKFEQNIAVWEETIAKGVKNSSDVIAAIETKYTLTDAQRAQIEALDNVIDAAPSDDDAPPF